MHRNPSTLPNRFSQVPKAEIPRSSFDRSHSHKTTINSGLLYPVLLDEALPGDTYRVNSTMFGRLATPLFPLMDNLFVDVHYFAVPMRLVWDNWQKFNGEQKNPNDSTDFLVPQMVSPVGGYAEQSLEDYMGIPPKIASLSHSCLWHRAYNLIWNEWFRDQNLQDSVVVNTGDGPDLPADYKLLPRGKRHDYFTSCLPWPQKGPGVTIPLGTTAPLKFKNAAGLLSPQMTLTPNIDLSTLSTVTIPDDPANFPVGTPAYADLSAATAATINSLRQAFQIQKIYERDARGGTRYTEIVRAHFGVTSPDARLQRPEYLGGGSVPVGIQPVPQTSSSGAYADTPQGNLAAFGTVLANGQGFNMSFTEHCLILGLVSVRADMTYQQGLERMFSRRTRFDFYWPALAGIGEQAVTNREIYAQGTSADDEVFGYQERYAEYRYKPSRISGLFRSSAAQSLDAWHLAQEFANLPVLNDEFIVEAPPVDRVVAVPSEPQFLLDCYFKMTCARPMPTYGVPGLIDHF